MTTTTRAAITAGAIALALVGCGTTGDDTVQESTATAAVATPTEIQTPDPRDACTVEMTASDGSDHQDRAAITCGAEAPITLSGDFREKVTNRYSPDQAQGVERVLVVGDEVRVWTAGCFLVFDTADGTPQSCRATGEALEGQDELTPEDLDRDQQTT